MITKNLCKINLGKICIIETKTNILEAPQNLFSQMMLQAKDLGDSRRRVT